MVGLLLLTCLGALWWSAIGPDVKRYRELRREEWALWSRAEASRRSFRGDPQRGRSPGDRP